jgi:hypothetical protein
VGQKNGMSFGVLGYQASPEPAKTSRWGGTLRGLAKTPRASKVAPRLGFSEFWAAFVSRQSRNLSPANKQMLLKNGSAYRMLAAQFVFVG